MTVAPSALNGNLYDRITAQIIAQLESGVPPWEKPWDTLNPSPGLPYNAETRRPYGGINTLLLWATAQERGYLSNGWLTFKQMADLGGRLRRIPGATKGTGQKSTMAVKAGRFLPKPWRPMGDTEAVNRETGEIVHRQQAERVYLKHFQLFNVDQMEGLPFDVADPPAPLTPDIMVDGVRNMIRGHMIDVRYGGDVACFIPARDVIHMPRPERFKGDQIVHFHATQLHEMTHWTGHESRLNRPLRAFRADRSGYAFEELIAECGAAFLCARLGISYTTQHASYIDNWLGVLREDSHAIINAAAAAMKAADYLLDKAGLPVEDVRTPQREYA